MDYYLEVPSNYRKADYILGGALLGAVPGYAAEEVSRPASFSDIPDGKALVVVIDNGLFEAAGYAYSEREFAAFTDPTDHRPKRYLLLDRDVAEKTSGKSE